MTHMTYRATADFARKMDAEDPLAKYRPMFHIPKAKNGKDCIYFCGNSLGLQPVMTKDAVMQELEDWKNMGVEAHFHGKHAWMPYHEFMTNSAAKLVGALPSEVVIMNALTVNLNLLMVSFYRPTKERFKIVIEGTAFPSDQYAVKSQILFHGFDPVTALIELKPRAGEDTIRTEDVEALIAREGKSIALIMLGGVNYYTGQLFDMARITKAGHGQGCMVGFDLAHAAGNAVLKLHDWGVDFACWCSYKYLNSGPGSTAGAFVHERHGKSPDLPRFAGWWGHDKKTRFKMGPDFHVMEGAEGWQISNPPILSSAPVRASLDLFAEVGMEKLRAKSLKLTGYLEFLLDSINDGAFSFITPRNPDERGCQLSIRMKGDGKKVFNTLIEAGVICDWREPDCIRVAPVPFYNSFSDVFHFAELFAAAIGKRLKMQEAV